MDVDFRNLLIFGGVCAMCACVFFSSCAYQNHSCKMEAIKAGMKADEVTKACHI